MPIVSSSKQKSLITPPPNPDLGVQNYFTYYNPAATYGTSKQPIVSLDDGSNVLLAAYANERKTPDSGFVDSNAGQALTRIYKDGSEFKKSVGLETPSIIINDNNGNIIAIGSFTDDQGDTIVQVIKFSKTFFPVWTKDINLGAPFNFILWDAAADSLGNIYIAGKISNNGFVYRLNANGTKGWAQTFNSSVNNAVTDEIKYITVDPFDDIILTGFYDYFSDNASIIIKLRANGDLVWINRWALFLIQAISTDSVGNIYLTGTGTNSLSRAVYVAKMSDAFVLEWVRYYNISGSAVKPNIARSIVDSNDRMTLVFSAEVSGVYGSGIITFNTDNTVYRSYFIDGLSIIKNLEYNSITQKIIATGGIDGSYFIWQFDQTEIIGAAQAIDAEGKVIVETRNYQLGPDVTVGTPSSYTGDNFILEITTDTISDGSIVYDPLYFNTYGLAQIKMVEAFEGVTEQDPILPFGIENQYNAYLDNSTYRPALVFNPNNGNSKYQVTLPRGVSTKYGITIIFNPSDACFTGSGNTYAWLASIGGSDTESLSTREDIFVTLQRDGNGVDLIRVGVGKDSDSDGFYNTQTISTPGADAQSPITANKWYFLNIARDGDQAQVMLYSYDDDYWLIDTNFFKTSNTLSHIVMGRTPSAVVDNYQLTETPFVGKIATFRIEDSGTTIQDSSSISKIIRSNPLGSLAVYSIQPENNSYTAVVPVVDNQLDDVNTGLTGWTIKNGDRGGFIGTDTTSVGGVPINEFTLDRDNCRLSKTIGPVIPGQTYRVSVETSTGGIYGLLRADNETTTFPATVTPQYNIGDPIVMDDIDYDNTTVREFSHTVSDGIYFAKSRRYTGPLDPQPIVNIYTYNESGTVSLYRSITKTISSTTSRWGQSLDLADPYIVIGDPDVSSSEGGLVDIYNIHTGELVVSISNPNSYGGTGGDQFGFDVSIDTSVGRVAVGTPYEDGPTSFTNAGKVYVFDLTGTLLFTKDNPDPTGSWNSVEGSSYVNDRFGYSVVFRDGILIVGAIGEDTAGADQNNAGKVYGFRSTGTTGFTIDNIASNPGSMNMGYQMAFHNGKLVIGAPEVSGGRIFIYDVTSYTTATFRYIISNPDINGSPPFDFFGGTLDIKNNIILAGARFEDVSDVNASGAAYLIDAITGSVVQTITQDTPVASEYFGARPAIGDNYLVINETVYPLEIIRDRAVVELEVTATTDTLAVSIENNSEFLPTTITELYIKNFTVKDTREIRKD